MALKAKVYINSNELFSGLVWRDLDQFKKELYALMFLVSIVTTLEQWL